MKASVESPESATASGERKKYRGLYYNKDIKKWMSKIYHQGKGIGLGSFSSDVEAAVAFDKACLYLRGRDAELNFDLSDYIAANGELIEDPAIRDRIESCMKMNGPEMWVTFDLEIFLLISSNMHNHLSFSILNLRIIFLISHL